MDAGVVDADVLMTVRLYLEGMIFADEGKLKQAFFESASIVGHYMGALEWLSLDAFVSACRAAGPAPVGHDIYCEVLAADITGDVAAIRLVDEYLGSRFTDQITLLRHDGQWRIVNKTYFQHC